MGVIIKRVGYIVAGFFVGIIVAIPFQMMLPFPAGLYAIVVCVIIFTIIFAVIAYYKTKNSGKSPRSIIDERYAKGDITKEEFDDMKKNLED